MKSLATLSTLAAAALGFAVSECPGADAGSPPAGPYELKNRSVVQLDPEARIPFWPIGWQKPKAVTATEAGTPEVTKLQLLPQHFNLTSILLGNPALATINGRSFAEGETLPVVYGAERLRVFVKAIRDGGVWLDHEGQQIFVPLRRPEVGVRPSQQRIEPAEFSIKIPAGAAGQ